MMESSIVLYPSSGIGHLVSMVELSKLILTHHPTFSINIVIIGLPANPTAAAATPVNTSKDISSNSAKYIATISATIPSIKFHYLPQITLPPNTTLGPVELGFFIPSLNNPNLHQFLQNLSQTSKLKAFILDFFCDAAFEVSTGLNIPTYYYFTNSAGGLSVLLYYTILRESLESRTNLDDEDAFKPTINVSWLPTIPNSELPEANQDFRSDRCKKFLDLSLHMTKASGLLVNSFDMFENKTITALRDGVPLPGKSIPPVFPVGPVIKTNMGSKLEDESGCLSWLNGQPSKSVVFLCFGSLGRFSATQLTDMAVGLENSGHRFLWVVRDPPDNNGDEKNKERELEEILPKGFLERTKERGLVVKRWAPQMAILSHGSVGGFVTHCGWSSVMEAISNGVPMLGWPLYAEQRMNRIFLVEGLKVALSFRESKDGFVSATELENRVKELMDSDSVKGKEVREWVWQLKEGAVAAKKVGGSSHVALSKFIELWNNN